jgi:toxin ParE1/3/4
MPQLKLRFTTNAKRDLDEIFDYLSARDLNAAKSVINAIGHSAGILVNHPLSARQTDMVGIRVKKVPRFPYLIFFSVSENFLFVIRISHSSQQWPEESDL